MNIILLDCYTDEPSGLGVPPYLGTYPRYIYGKIIEEPDNIVKYLTIDDVRLLEKYDNVEPKLSDKQKTRIDIYNLTKNSFDVKNLLEDADQIIVILGVHTPGKYLSAIPGTLREIQKYIKDYKAEKILTGPAASEHGTQLEGGKRSEKPDMEIWDDCNPNHFNLESFKEIDKYAPKGAELLDQLNNLDNHIMEIETSTGCFRDIGCSYCVEASKPQNFREQEDIHKEIKALWEKGARHFRLGKQTCFYSYKKQSAEEIEKLLKPIAELGPKTLHIDNANPVMVNEEITKLIVKYCTPGNIAAFGVESFDVEVIKKNQLNSTPQTTLNAIRIINKYGSEIGKNGMPKFLPGINILFGLEGESKKTQLENMKYLHQILDEDLLVRRINIRKVVPFPGTPIYERVGNKFLRKNEKHYWKWRNQIRQEIDTELLKRVAPINTIIKDCIAEVHDGGITFCRQLGTYPLIIGVKERLQLGKRYNLKITGHMLRSITGEVVN
ncbi:radical SAM protein [Candidatus Woesearchaeota archaeon]|nr:MAG: radical SAM protein [Candidatus Woesearchaeota archaeon]